MGQKAKAGLVWVCAACGKRSQDRMGDHAIDHGWDESCYMHAVLCHQERDSEGRYVAAETEEGQDLSGEPG